MRHCIAILMVALASTLPVHASDVESFGREIENNDAVGDLPWSFFYAGGDPYAPHVGFGGAVQVATGYVVDESVRLSTEVGGVRTLVGDDKATGESLDYYGDTITYGGPADLWGRTWTAAEINSTHFGFAFAIYDTVDEDSSEYMHTWDYRMMIPEDATPTGVQVDVLYDNEWDIQYVESMHVTVYYTDSCGTACQITR